MKTTTIKGLTVSALSLGTVQLGLNYGISNTGGKPSLETAFSILDTAVKNGINTLDTAAGYGDSEEVIGKWLKTKPESEHPFIVTKISGLDHSSLDALRKCVREKLEESKKRLGISKIPLLMLHRASDYLDDKENMITVFNELKASGDIDFSGISVYSNTDYGEIAESGIDAVQIPLNLFDCGQVINGGVEKLRKAGMMIFVRSVYLQGLVFRDPYKLEDDMQFAYETLVKFRSLCDKYKLSPAALAISYVSSIKGFTSLVLGCDNPDQVSSNVELIGQTVQLSDEQMNEIHEAFKDSPRKLLDPGQWPNAQK